MIKRKKCLVHHLKVKIMNKIQFKLKKENNWLLKIKKRLRVKMKVLHKANLRWANLQRANLHLSNKIRDKMLNRLKRKEIHQVQVLIPKWRKIKITWMKIKKVMKMNILKIKRIIVRMLETFLKMNKITRKISKRNKKSFLNQAKLLMKSSNLKILMIKMSEYIKRENQLVPVTGWSEEIQSKMQILSLAREMFWNHVSILIAVRKVL
jgi:hypothetical protein